MGYPFISKKSLFALVTLSLVMSGCSSVSYLMQAAKGQWELSNLARPIDEVIADERTDPRIQGLLREIDAIKSYGESLGLKHTSNYSDYVQLDRKDVVTVVSASDALRFRPRRWKFPIVGSFTYIGYFDAQDAREEAKKLEQEGLDVYVRGAPAFSSLGWFRDPVLSSMIDSGPTALGNLVNTILHEMVHVTRYVNNQSYFNESLASFVADQMTPVYLKEQYGADSEVYQAYQKQEVRVQKFSKAFHAAYLNLKELYQSSESTDLKKQKKSQILSALKEELKIKTDVNNARLIQFRTYGLGSKGFEELFASCNRDWTRFFEALSDLESDSFTKEHSEDFEKMILRPKAQACKS